MPSFKQWMACEGLEDIDSWITSGWIQHASRADVARIVKDHPDFIDKLDDFLAQHGFTDIAFLNAGSGSWVFKDTKNPALVLRITGEGERDLLPQILQPLHVERISDDPKLFLELLPGLQHIRAYDPLLDSYMQEMEAIGCRVNTMHPHCDIGLFTYHDSAGSQKTAPMGMDSSLSMGGTEVPTCTKGYPTLEDQWREQCRLVAADARLKNLIGTPKKFPPTKIIPSPTNARAA